VIVTSGVDLSVGAIMALVSSMAAQLNKDTHEHGSFTDRLSIAKNRVGELHHDRPAVENALVIDLGKRLQ
jgi:ribose/xylose/arabinose/galactoside ABC-type transport system permease subunit